MTIIEWLCSVELKTRDDGRPIHPTSIILKQNLRVITAWYATFIRCFQEIMYMDGHNSLKQVGRSFFLRLSPGSVMTAKISGLMSACYAHRRAVVVVIA
jgi:hypothetical protein